MYEILKKSLTEELEPSSTFDFLSHRKDSGGSLAYGSGKCPSKWPPLLTVAVLE